MIFGGCGARRPPPPPPPPPGDGNRQSNFFGEVHQHYYPAGDPVVWPVRMGRPPVLAECFQPREPVRVAVESGLTRGGASAATVVLTGDGGHGKTQLAARVYQSLTGDTGLDLAVWVTATSRDGVLSEFGRAAAAVGLPAAADAEVKAQRFLEWLAGTGRSWLVVLDDVADPADLRQLWPEGPGGRVVVTTRRRDAALIQASGRTLVEVDLYTPAEASAYLRERFDAVAGLPLEVADQAEDLAADLGFLPLAIGQAAAVVVDEAITCALLRQRLADRTRLLVEVLPQAAGDHQRSALASTWSLALARVDAMAPAGLGSRVAALVAVLDPNGVPEQVLTSSAALRLLASSTATAVDGRPAQVSEAAVHRAVRNLHWLSVVSHLQQRGVPVVRMHALTQRAVREAAPDVVTPAMVRGVADALVEVWPDIERDPELGRLMRSNAAALTETMGDPLWEPTAHAVLFRLGHSLGEAGQVTAARAYFAQIADLAGRALGPDHPDTLTTRNNLARWRGEAGDPAGAATAYEALLADQLRVLGPDHPDTLTTRNNLAAFRGQTGNPAGAATTYETLLADRLRVLVERHSQRRRTLRCPAVTVPRNC